MRYGFARFSSWLTLSATLFFTTGQVLRAEPPADEKMIVIKEKVSIGTGKNVTAQVLFGEVLTIDRIQDKHAWVREYAAWIPKEAVQALVTTVHKTTARIDQKPSAADYLLRGQAQRYLGENVEAQADLNLALRLDPAFAPAYAARGDYYYRSHQTEEALADLNRAIELDPNNRPALMTRSLLFADREQFEQAFADIGRVLQQFPADPNALNNRGVFWREQGQFDKAIADYTLALKATPRHAKALANRGFAWNRKRQYARARDDLQAAARLAPRSWETCNDLAWFLATCADVSFRNGEQAVQIATRAVELTDEKEWSTLDTLAAAYAQTGDFEKAVEWSKKALDLAPEDSKVAVQEMLAQYTDQLGVGKSGE